MGTPYVVYIAGPMSGYANFNYDAFNEAERIIMEVYGIVHDDECVTIINPAKNFDGRQDLPWDTYIEKAEEQVSSANLVVLLEGWSESAGVQRELDAAKKNGVDVVEFEVWTGRRSPMNEKDPTCVVGNWDPGDWAQRDSGRGFCEEHMSATIDGVCDDCDRENDDQWGGPCDCPECTAAYQPHPAFAGGRIVDEAWDLVMGDRQSNYGHPAQDFEATGRMVGAILTNHLRSTGYLTADDDPIPDIDPRIMALIIMTVKLSREANSHKHDNLVDIIGYAVCADRIERKY